MGAQRSPATNMVKKVAKKGEAKKVEFPKSAVIARKRKSGVGGAILPKRDLTRFVRWPKYIRLQRAKMTLLKRIKIPPAINQFSQTLDKSQASELFRLLNRLKPETKAAKKERLQGKAKAVASGEKTSDKKPTCVKMGINHVTTLIEEKKAKLVVIAHDVDPVEIVVWLPALCKARGVPYVIVKGKARVGAVVSKKTASCLAITEVTKDFENMVKIAENNFNGMYEEHNRTWGSAVPSNRQ